MGEERLRHPAGAPIISGKSGAGPNGLSDFARATADEAKKQTAIRAIRAIDKGDGGDEKP